MARHRVLLEGGDFPIAPGIEIPARRLGPPTAIPSRPTALVPESLGDSRGFVHRRIIGAVGGFITGGPTAAISGFLRGGRQPEARVQTALAATVPMRAACPPGFFETPAGGCQEMAPTGRTEFLAAAREDVSVRGGTTRLPSGTVMEDGGPPQRFGPMRAGGYAPDVREQFYRDCGPGAVLAKDGLCYNRRDLRNNERKWPRGRRPLLTGGEVRAISTAASAAKKLQRVQKRLMSLGLLPKPTRRAAPKQLAPGHHAHVAHDGSQH